MFELHPQLKADTQAIGDLKLCSLCLMNNASLPWLVLVPRRAQMREIIDLTRADQIQLIDEISQTSQLLLTEFKPDKINVAALGNVVPQLHIHVVARYANDPAWPKPVWGNLPAKAYAAQALSELVDRLRSQIIPTP